VSIAGCVDSNVRAQHPRIWLARTLLLGLVMLIKTTSLALLLALVAASSIARAEAPRPTSRALFDRCAEATARARTNAKTTLDLDLLEVALAGAEKGDEQCAGVAQRLLLQHMNHLDAMTPATRARAEVAYARAFAAFGTPELELARQSSPRMRAPADRSLV
jgi:hypothetical protein